MDGLTWGLLGGALAFGASFLVLTLALWAASRRDHYCEICGTDLHNKFSLLSRDGARLCPHCWDIEYPREGQ
jgi:hypothetical protein